MQLVVVGFNKNEVGMCLILHCCFDFLHIIHKIMMCLITGMKINAPKEKEMYGCEITILGREGAWSGDCR